MSITQEAIFIGANKQSFVADYSNEVIAYAASNTVALWKPLSKNGVFHTLKKHTKEVTGVKFLPNSGFLVSVGADAQVNVWKSQAGEFLHFQSLASHTQSVTCLAVINAKVFVTGGADKTISVWVWSDETGSFALGSSFEVKKNFYPTTCILQSVGNGYVLVIGGTSPLLYVYSVDSKGTANESTILAGHEDWMKCLSFVEVEENKSYILASGSQDRYIRLWDLKINEIEEDDSNVLTLLSNKKYSFNVGDIPCTFNFDALIVGHDDWVTGLKWHPTKLQLLSSSADTALMIWEMDQDSGIWCCINRLGEMSIKGASTATGSSGGFWSCLWVVEDNQEYVFTNGKTGSFRMYKKSQDTFESVLGVTGPVKEVTDLAWSADGDYFLSTSLDQTTRLFAPLTDKSSWHEFARPQIHGFDMICVSALSETSFVSAGDEKVLRIFQMTSSIGNLLSKLCGISISTTIESASLPVLGLSNKAANEQLEHGHAAQTLQDIDEGNAPTAAVDILADLTTPPLEDHLQRYTLFPELEKLYGHGYEITCCATHENLIASACRSNSTKHAAIRVFKDSQQIQILEAHNLTITSLQFSPNGKYLLGVSRDRQFSLWSINGDEFKLVELNEKAHNRIIWDCSWAPDEFGEIFVTSSRDKFVKIWGVDQSEPISSIKLKEPITSVSVYKHVVDGKIIIAAGLESGAISIFTWNKDFELVTEVDYRITPSGRISKLAFSTRKGDLWLGVGSNDTSVRLYKLQI